MVKFVCLRSDFDVAVIEKQEEIIANSKSMIEVKNLHDEFVGHAVATVERFTCELPGMAPCDIIQKADSFLDRLHHDGVERISGMCFSAVSRLFMLGRSLVYNAKTAAGEHFIVGYPIDKDILGIDWSRDCFGKAKIIKQRAKEANILLESVSQSFALAMSKVGGDCLTAIKKAGDFDSEVLQQEFKCVQQKIDQYCRGLQLNKKMAAGNIFHALEILSDLLNYTSLPVD